MTDWDEAYDHWMVPAVDEVEELEKEIADVVDVNEYREEIARLKRECPWVVVGGGVVITDVDPDQFVRWVSRHKTMKEAMEHVVSSAGEADKGEE